MATYKMGNKVTGIIRSLCVGKLGEMTMTYDNQPYALLKDVSVTLNFSQQNTETDVGDKTHMSFNHDTLNQVQISNVKLNNKILELLYTDNQREPLFAKQENYTSDEEGNVYLNFNDKVYQVFIYDSDGNLETAYGELENNVLTLNKPEEEYSIYYSVLGDKSFYFDKPNNIYVTLDLCAVGNEDDQTQDMSIHIEKCLIKADKGMYFNRTGSNTIDLTCEVIYTGLDYITIK